MPLTDVLDFIALHSGKRFALVPHARPDGDALGSAVGLARCLIGIGCSATVVNPLPLPGSLDFIADPDLIASHDDPEWWRGYDCLGVLDCGDEDRVSLPNRTALGNLPTFTIDHHATSRGLGEAVWIDPAASSTGEMIVRLAEVAGWSMDKPAAQALWTAIVTDTGRFSFENTTEAALAAAMRCVAAGAEPTVAASHIYQSVSVPERRLELIVLERMQLLEDGRLAISWLRRDDFARVGAGVEGASNLIDILRDTKGVEVAVFFYETPTDAKPSAPIKVSLRTRAPHSALDIVVPHGGGGHKRAAGCSLSGTMEEARAMIIEEAGRFYFGAGATAE
ncbi:MAG: bifunctional oligoribonuclease/PAP phosphatase NrnA [Planctomycetaceae bacterium]|nr:bifunctional oligoribonuclease/PAP phosphatase NrnA [Planctomycetaceae bacterium]